MSLVLTKNQLKQFEIVLIEFSKIVIDVTIGFNLLYVNPNQKVNNDQSC